MTRSGFQLRLVAALVLFWQTSGDAAANEIKLGTIPRYPNEAAAHAACGADPVIWADTRSGFFYPKFHPDFGKSAHGAYSCYGQAKKADYWSFTPEDEGGRKGREFPLMFCSLCS